MNINLNALRELMKLTGKQCEVKEVDLWGELENYMDAGIKPGWVLLAQGVTEEGKTVVVYIID